MQTEMGKPAALVAIVADIAVHVAHQLPHQRQAETLARRLGRNEGLEDMVAQRRIDAGTIVADGDLDRQRHRRRRRVLALRALRLDGAGRGREGRQTLEIGGTYYRDGTVRLKPDITAPGVEILAGASPQQTVTIQQIVTAPCPTLFVSPCKIETWRRTRVALHLPPASTVSPAR